MDFTVVHTLFLDLDFIYKFGIFIIVMASVKLKFNIDRNKFGSRKFPNCEERRLETTAPNMFPTEIWAI